MADYLTRVLTDGTIKQYPLMSEAGVYDTHVLKLNDAGTDKFVPITKYENGDALFYVDKNGNKAHLSPKGELYIAIKQGTDQTITAKCVDSFGTELGSYTDDFLAPYGATVYLTASAPEGYDAGDMTIEDGAYMTVTITQSAHQMITVHEGSEDGTAHTETFSILRGTKIYPEVVADEGYTVGAIQIG